MNFDTPKAPEKKKPFETEPIFAHSFGFKGTIERQMKDTTVTLGYSSPNPIDFIQKMLNQNILFEEYPFLKNLEIFRNLRKIDSLTLNNGRNGFDVRTIVPDYDIYFFINAHPLLHSSVNIAGKKMFINGDPMTKTGLLSLGHEAGHVEARERNSEEKNDKMFGARLQEYFSPERVSEDSKRLITEDERDAWARALHNLKPFLNDLGIEYDETYSHIHNNCLDSYDKNLAVFSEMVAGKGQAAEGNKNRPE